VTRKVLASVIAVIVAASLTLAVLLGLVQGTIDAVSLDRWPLRLAAVLADLMVGAFLLVGCIWVATRLAVAILGVGNTEFPPLPEEHGDEGHSKN
jgi:hypothetical protein